MAHDVTRRASITCPNPLQHLSVNNDQPFHTASIMALPSQLQETMLPAELEFIASEELVEIFPVVKMDKIQFITVCGGLQRDSAPLADYLNDQGLYGPFIGGRPTRVPLWVAVNLKLKKKCSIVPPDWLNVGVSHA